MKRNCSKVSRANSTNYFASKSQICANIHKIGKATHFRNDMALAWKQQLAQEY